MQEGRLNRACGWLSSLTAGVGGCDGQVVADGEIRKWWTKMASV